MLIIVKSSQTFYSYFPLFDVDHRKIAKLLIVFYPLGNFGQALRIKSCYEDLILTRKSHNCSGIAFIQGDSAGGSELIEQLFHSTLGKTQDGSSKICSCNVMFI